jgi:hypothetical protein
MPDEIAVVNKFYPQGDHVSDTTLSTVTDLSSIAGTRGKILIQALAQNIRFTLGSNDVPSATVGFVLKVGDQPVIIDLEGVTLQIIEETSGAIAQYVFGD